MKVFLYIAAVVVAIAYSAFRSHRRRVMALQGPHAPAEAAHQRVLAGEREKRLRSIAPEDAKQHHEELRSMFVLEVERRRHGRDHEHFENLYHCAFLLYQVGDPRDVEMMWEAKHINFDTGSGFDLEYLVGAGVEPTLTYLDVNGLSTISAAIRAEFPSESSAHIERWQSERRQYFCVAGNGA